MPGVYSYRCECRPICETGRRNARIAGPGCGLLISLRPRVSSAGGGGHRRSAGNRTQALNTSNPGAYAPISGSQMCPHAANSSDAQRARPKPYTTDVRRHG